MIDFVAKSYEENRFDPDKVLRSVAERSSVAEPVEAHRRSKFFGRVSAHGHFGKLSDRNNYSPLRYLSQKARLASEKCRP